MISVGGSEMSYDFLLNVIAHYLFGY